MSDQDSNTMDGVPPAPGPASLSAALTARYDLLGELGRGGMGIVYRARDRETGEIVALKVLKPEIAADESAMERFKNELRLARKITHKNVCRIHEFSRAGSAAYISMEYVEGDSLRSILSRSEGLRVGKGIQIVQQICAGLREAHAQGVVHRDLKPENILIARDGTVKVMDFGVARSLEGGMTKAGALVGTPAYMSPEQAEGKPADPRSDIYALGLVLYEMLTGATAFRGDTPFSVALKQIHEMPPPPRQLEPALPVHIERAILKCLEKAPAKRFQSVDELEAALSEKGEARPAVAQGTEVTLPLHLTRWQASDWLLVFAAVAGLALYFPFFNRTSLAPRSNVSFDNSVLRRIAQEYAQRLGAPTEGEGRIETDVSPVAYDFVAERAGARAALELCNNPVPYWMWVVTWDNGTRVWVDNRGALWTFVRDVPAGAASQKLPLEEAKPLAENALRDYFGRQASEMALETAASMTWKEQPAASFTWADRNDYHGLKARYRVRLFGREVAFLNRTYDLPAGYVGRDIVPAWMILPWFAFNFVLLIVGISQRHVVDLSMRWRPGIVAIAFITEGWASWRLLSLESPFPISVTRAICFCLGLAVALLTFFMLIAIEWSVRRTAPSKLVSLVRLFTRAAASESCGLAVLRGTFVGLGLLAGETFLVWSVTSHSNAHLDSYFHILTQARLLSDLGPSTEALCVLAAMLLGVIIASIVGFLTSLMGRLSRRPWQALLAGAALSVVFLPSTGLGAVQPYYWKALVLLFDSLVLAWTFTRFDLLTLGWAAFTMIFCWENYHLLVMLTPAGILEPWIGFAVFGLFVLAAGVVAFKTPLRAAYRRAAAAFG